jgi:DNA gyrase subunit A
MATRRGVVKKVPIGEFANARARGIVAIRLDEGDNLVAARLTTGGDEVVLATRKGWALRFHERAVRAMGRATRGVQGIRIWDKDELAGVGMVREGEQMLLVSEFGFGKRIAYDNFSAHGRGTRGQVAYKASDKSGDVVAALSVSPRDDVVCITSQGNTVKLRLSEVAVLGKTAMGVRIVNITKPDMVVGVARVVKEEEGEREAAGASSEMPAGDVGRTRGAAVEEGNEVSEGDEAGESSESENGDTEESSDDE